MAEKSVTISNTPTKTSEMFDMNGNKIDPVTKQIIEEKKEDE